MNCTYKKILCGKMYNGIDAELKENMEILIEGQYIKEVGQSLACPPETEIIDLKHLTVTPGMIDAHIHPQFFSWKELDRDTVFNSDGYRALATYSTAERCLYGGFTTIRSMGWFRESYELDVKRAINEGHLPGARMVIAPHLLGTTGSHGDMTQVARDNPTVMDFLEKEYVGTGNGADFFTAAVRREKKLGGDFIKIMATGGFATPYDDPDDIQLNDAEFKAIFDTARELKIPVTAHVYGNRLMQKLMGYGIQCMEHGALMNEETARMFEETGTYLVPTFCPYQDSVYPDPEQFEKKSETYKKKMNIYQTQLQSGRQTIINSKIKLGFGTDFVVVHDNFESGWEYSAWMNSGCDAFRILEAATKTNSEICGMADVIGTIEPGKYADIAGWGRDLLTDPDALRDCGFVMKDGVEYKAQSYVHLT